MQMSDVATVMSGPGPFICDHSTAQMEIPPTPLYTNTQMAHHQKGYGVITRAVPNILFGTNSAFIFDQIVMTYRIPIVAHRL